MFNIFSKTDYKEAGEDENNSTKHEKQLTPLTAGKWILVVRNIIRKHFLLNVLRSLFENIDMSFYGSSEMKRNSSLINKKYSKI